MGYRTFYFPLLFSCLMFVIVKDKETMEESMRLIHKLADLYYTYRRIMWLIGLLSMIGIPVGSYGLYFLQTIKTKQGLMTDNPELANAEPTVDIFDWLTGVGGVIGNITGILTLICIVFILFLIVFHIVCFIGKRTEVSGTDKQQEQQEKVRRKIEEDEETFDDYGID